MNIQSAAVLAIAFFMVTLAVIRTVPKRRILTIIFLLLPLGILTYRWATFRSAFWEWLVGALVGSVATLAWWLLKGQNLPPPDDSNVRVWTKDEPFE
jgi:hypothetical protein